MRVHHLPCLMMIRPLLVFGAPPDPESFDLEVTLNTPYNHDFTVQTIVCVGHPFEFTATNGPQINKASGTLQAPTKGVYPLELTVSEWESEKENIRDSTQLKLELGKAWVGGPISSSLYMRHVVVRRHQSRLKPE